MTEAHDSKSPETHNKKQNRPPEPGNISWFSPPRLYASTSSICFGLNSTHWIARATVLRRRLESLESDGHDFTCEEQFSEPPEKEGTCNTSLVGGMQLQADFS